MGGTCSLSADEIDRCELRLPDVAFAGSLLFNCLRSRFLVRVNEFLARLREIGSDVSLSSPWKKFLGGGPPSSFASSLVVLERLS